MIASRADYDAVVVGGSLAGCSTAMLLACTGARVALVEQRADPLASKRVCGHFIQASAIPTLRRMGLLEPIEAAGALRSQLRIWTRWGMIVPPTGTSIEPAVNLRRERLDPLVRAAAAETPGVDLIAGRAVKGLIRSAGRFAGVELAGRDGRRARVRGRLVVGADGRDSFVAREAGVRSRLTPHGRFSYAAYYEGPAPAGAPDSTLWFTDPGWAAAFPTDSGLTMYACMLTLDRLDEFKRDTAGALEAAIAGLPDAPPIRDSRRVSPVIGKVRMPNAQRDPAAPGLALAGDAALATDPLWGVGCGWAFQSAEWLADSVSPALRDQEPLQRGLRRYRLRFLRRLAGHALIIDDYATGRRFSAVERLIFSGAARDPRVAERMLRFGTRDTGPSAIASPRVLARSVAAGVRHRPDAGPSATAAAELGEPA